MKISQPVFDLLMVILFAVSALVAAMWIAVMKLDNKETYCYYESIHTIPLQQYMDRKMVCKPKKKD